MEILRHEDQKTTVLERRDPTRRTREVRELIILKENLNPLMLLFKLRLLT